MQWSRLKAQAEALLAPVLQSRLEYRTTQYRHAHDLAGRSWITLDGVQLIDMSTLRALTEQHREATSPDRLSPGVLWPDWATPEGRRAYWARFDDAEEACRARGIFSQWDFRDGLAEYLNLSVDVALGSHNPIHVALALVDRRLGRGRFLRLPLDRLTHPLARLLYEVRRKAEGWPVVANAEA